MPVFPEVGSIIMLLSFFNMPFFSASLIIQYAALSLTEPNGLFHSNFANILIFSFENDVNSTIGVFPILFITVDSIIDSVILFCLLYSKN